MTISASLLSTGQLSAILGRDHDAILTALEAVGASPRLRMGDESYFDAGVIAEIAKSGSRDTMGQGLRLCNA